ncbi:oligopeptide ABC transporter permease [Piscibacillus halophilus]|uniref:Peptide/nickel transport system permease protein n=1 Tax=Piscibacillus halophilus TaxID=571933 RepID=A0A1H9E5R3_9BACI|nr:oligopeptide ABC transporter permease [Piscibacillus halophilus]SEQ21009.1 peptide/nickel transport system permease protein [Piscibacillus halophilus]
MWKFIVRRLLITTPQIVLLSAIVFILAQLMPGDALTGLIDPTVKQERLEELRVQLGLDNPWYIQYRDWVAGIVQGDFGRSFIYKMDVTELIGQRIVNTIWLSVVSVFFIYAIGLPLGIISGRYNDRLIDQLITGYTYIGFATPIFIFGLIAVWIFGFVLGWFPTGGSVAPGLDPGTLEYYLSKIHHVLLPALSIALIGTVGTVQYLRSEIVDTKQRDFIITARAKGASESRVYNRHIFRNSILPIAAFFGYEIVNLINGTVLIEQIFSYPGMGNLFLESIVRRDTTVAITLVLISGIGAILGALLSDIILSMVDPRIRIK